MPARRTVGSWSGQQPANWVLTPKTRAVVSWWISPERLAATAPRTYADVEPGEFDDAENDCAELAEKPVQREVGHETGSGSQNDEMGRRGRPYAV